MSPHVVREQLPVGELCDLRVAERVGRRQLCPSEVRLKEVAARDRLPQECPRPRVPATSRRPLCLGEGTTAVFHLARARMRDREKESARRDRACGAGTKHAVRQHLGFGEAPHEGERAHGERHILGRRTPPRGIDGLGENLLVLAREEGARDGRGSDVFGLRCGGHTYLGRERASAQS